MSTTPVRSVLNTSVFSPVRFLDSPLSSKSLSRQDALGIRDRTKSIIKTLAENHRKWDEAERRGVTLCNSIENVKARAISVSLSTPSTPSFPASNVQAGADGSTVTLYPEELKMLCEKLRIITTIFEDVLESAKELKNQLNANIQLGSNNIFAEQTIVLKTWTCDRLVKCAGDIIECYENEHAMKVKCMQNIAHSRTKEELVLHTSVWEFPRFVTNDVAFWMAEMVLDGDIELEKK